jgi:integral membrane protein (TIGR01906 family)
MRILTLALGIAVTLAVPIVLAVTGIRVVTHDEYVQALYDHGDIPADRYGLTEAQRARLAETGLRSILPSSPDGIDVLREARLPDGAPAFDQRELRHMADVRTLVSHAYRLQLVLLVAIGALALLLGVSSASTRAVVPVALARGAVLTVGIALVVAIVSATRYDVFETTFHGLFFDGDSWRFDETETLRRLYPDRFWLDTAITVGALAVIQALVLLPLARTWARHAGAATHGMRMRTRTQSS